MEITIHGHTRVDNYYWLRERNNPDVIEYLESKNTYEEKMLAYTIPLTTGNIVWGSDNKTIKKARFIRNRIRMY